MGKARNHSTLQPSHTQHAAPVLAVNAHRRPLVGPVLAEPAARVVLDGLVELGRVELRVLEAGPHAADVGGLGGDAQPEAAVHVGAELELRGFCGRGGCEGELGEAVGDGFELEEGREADVHVGFADAGLHDGLDRLGVEDPHGDVLGDDLFVLPPQARLQVLLVKHVVVKRVIRRRRLDGRRGARVGRCGGDGHGEHGDAIFLGETQRGGDAVEGGLEGALKGLQREFEVDGVGGFRGLDMVVVEDEVHCQGT